MPPFRYNPPERGRLASLPVFCVLILSVALYAASGLIHTGGMTKPLLQLTAIGIAAAGLYFLIRWNLTAFRYELTEDCLRVFRLSGKQELCVCDLTLQTGLCLIRKEQFLAARKTGASFSETDLKRGTIQNYGNRFGEDNPLCYLYADADTECVLVLDYDPELEREITRRAQLASPDFRAGFERKEETH